MDIAIQLYGYLVLTFLGFISPALGVLLSLYNQGIAQLRKECEAEEARAKAQIKELAKLDKTDVEDIEQSINNLKETRQATKSKLQYLNPSKQIINLFVVLLNSFIFVLFSLVSIRYLWATIIFDLISIILLAGGIYIFYRLLLVLIEVKKFTDIEKEKDKAKIVDLLSSIVDKTDKGSITFLKDVAITIDRTPFKSATQNVSIGVNKMQGLEIGFVNNEKRMVKNLQIGFVFTRDFIININKTLCNCTIFSDSTQQIVRFSKDFIHGSTHKIFAPLNITALKVGEYTIKTFINAENIETTNGSFALKVTAKADEKIKQ